MKIKAFIICIILFFCSGIFAGGKKDFIAYKMQYCEDNNRVNVLTNTAYFDKDLGGHASISGGWLVDGITGASRKDVRGKLTDTTIDGVTSATSGREYRHQATGTFSYKGNVLNLFLPESEADNPTAFSATGIYSKEDDYVSTTGAFSVQQDLFEKNTSVGLAWSKSDDQFLPPSRFVPGPGDEGWNYFGSGKRKTDKLAGSITQVLSPTTLVALTAEGIFDRGYLARPYYVYAIETPGADDTARVFYRESTPPKRKVAALSARINRYLSIGRGAAASGDYRYTRDSWGINSHTIALDFNYRCAENVIVSPSYRYYTQSAAFFYRDVYAAVPSYLTTDFRLGKCFTNTVGLKLVVAMENFMKPLNVSYFAFYPVSFDIAGNFMTRSSTKDQAIRDSHYCYWPIGQGYRNFWVQSGVKFAF